MVRELTVCKDPECDREAKTRGLCMGHYQRAYNRGELDLRPKYTNESCLVDKCERMAYSKGLCRLHYSRLSRWGDALAVRPKGTKANPPLVLPEGLKGSELARVLGVSRQRIEQLQNPDRRRARHELKRALEIGQVSRAPMCARCFSTAAKLHGHHFDYSYPLDVIWYCAKCHGAMHAHLRAEGKA